MEAFTYYMKKLPPLSHRLLSEQGQKERDVGYGFQISPEVQQFLYILLRGRNSSQAAELRVDLGAGHRT
jgi:hypothetical protein